LVDAGAENENALGIVQTVNKTKSNHRVLDKIEPRKRTDARYQAARSTRNEMIGSMNAIIEIPLDVCIDD
jgi:hypothetical protein